MTANKQARKDEWEKEHVQRVLDYHNKEYGAHIEIKDKSIVVYPHLKGQTNWDWVCYNTKTGDEIAVEVKKITEQKLEKKAKVVYNLLHEVRVSLSSQLSGEFILAVNIPDEYSFPSQKQKQSRQIFKAVLAKSIMETSQRLNVGETEDLVQQINDKLPFELPNIMFCDLAKLNNDGNVLMLSPMIGSSWSIGFDRVELEKFKQLVSHANLQLSAANTEETFLILIEEGYRPIDPPEIADALKNINHDSYSQINHIYYVCGEKVEKSPLPFTP